MQASLGMHLSLVPFFSTQLIREQSFSSQSERAPELGLLIMNLHSSNFSDQNLNISEATTSKLPSSKRQSRFICLVNVRPAVSAIRRITAHEGGVISIAFCETRHVGIEKVAPAPHRWRRGRFVTHRRWVITRWNYRLYRYLSPNIRVWVTFKLVQECQHFSVDAINFAVDVMTCRWNDRTWMKWWNNLD